jgi:apolipoprotein N-acyltransferase
MVGNPTKQSGTVEIRIVQPNLPQNVKWDDDAQWRNLEHHIKLSRSTEAEETPPPRFIIWPETAVDADLDHFPDITRYIANSLPANSITVVGNMRVTLDQHKMPTGYHNSLTMFDKSAAVLGTYNKHHLVPFGEYIPFRHNFASIKPLAAAMSGIGDFTPGDGAKTLRPEGMPAFSPLICYEVIFPAAVVDQNDRPDWLVNVTNDGWYGRTAGPHQHLAIARLRAIEEGLPLARAANTGISAVIDPLGRIIAQQPLLTEGTLDSILPEALPPTLYSRIGDSAFWGLFLLFTALGLFMSYRQKSA